jgi:GLPGLI family protein
MKYTLLWVLFLSVFTIQAQTSGTILFEEKTDLHKMLPPERADMKDMIPQYNTSKFEFIFSDIESIYRPKKEEEITDTEAMQGGGRMRFGGRGNRVVYKNLELDTVIDSREFMQKQFLVVGPTKQRKWKIGMNQKEILGYTCMEASFQEDSANAIVAWFTPMLAVSNGPADFQHLPGMILQIDINDGQQTITASEIALEPIDPTALEAPTKGKEVTPEEFREIQQEKLKEMGRQPGSGGGHMIFMRG